MEAEFNVKDILLVFGANIRRAREMQGLGIAELAASIDYDRGCLSSLEYGEQNIEYSTALNLARKLNVPFPALFSRNQMIVLLLLLKTITFLFSLKTLRKL